LDQAPVYVSITTASRKNVLAVPVTALLVQPEGGYSVAVRSGGARRLVTVQPGLFGDGGLVEVSGSRLAEGQTVEVPARCEPCSRFTTSRSATPATHRSNHFVASA